MSPNIPTDASGSQSRPQQHPPRNVAKDAGRRILGLPSPETMTVPIPPSLLQSPHLTSPESVFQKPVPPSTPSAEDESWLRDTIPLTLSGLPESDRGPIEPSTLREEQSSICVIRSNNPKAKPFAVPPLSPPLVRTRSLKKYPEGQGPSSRWPSFSNPTAGRCELSEDYFQP